MKIRLLSVTEAAYDEAPVLWAVDDDTGAVWCCELNGEWTRALYGTLDELAAAIEA